MLNWARCICISPVCRPLCHSFVYNPLRHMLYFIALEPTAPYDGKANESTFPRQPPTPPGLNRHRRIAATREWKEPFVPGEGGK